MKSPAAASMHACPLPFRGAPRIPRGLTNARTSENPTFSKCRVGRVLRDPPIPFHGGSHVTQPTYNFATSKFSILVLKPGTVALVACVPHGATANSLAV